MSNPLFIHGSTEVTLGEFELLLSYFEDLVGTHKRLLVQIDHPILLNAAIIASRRNAKDLFLCPTNFSPKQITEIIDQFAIELFITNQEGVYVTQKTTAATDAASTGALYIFTSGTTGTPKITKHRWEDIQHPALMAKKLHHKRWMMTYALHTYAALQVFFTAYINDGTIVYPRSGDDLARSIIECRVEAISATPTWWKMVISRWPEGVPAAHLEQATLGGEIVNQDVIDLVQQFFKPKQITHIYASSEGGTTIVVSDGLAGFPVDFLEKDKNVRLRIKEGVLQIQSPHAMQGYLNAPSNITADGWINTGDLVELREKRVYFLGREDEMINVGGLKVNPEEVEHCLCRLPEIHDACVYAKKSPITGQIVAADVVMQAGQKLDPEALTKKLQKSLADYKIPRLIKQVQELEVSANGKKIRLR